MKEIFALTIKGIHDFLRYGIGSIIRWIFIFAAFIYLIFMTIALYEALNFQNYVENLFTEKSTARRVLVELYNHMNSTDSAPEKLYPVPLGAMAIRLDNLKNAAKELGTYQLNETEKGDGKANSPVDDTVSIKNEFEQKIKALEPALNNLHDLVFENSSMKIVETFIDIQTISEELEQYKIQDTDQSAKAKPNTIPPPPPPEEGKIQIPDQAAAESQTLVQRLQKKFKDLGNELPEGDSGEYKKILEDINKEIEGLKSKRAAANKFNTSIAKIINLTFILNETLLDDKAKLSQNKFEEIQKKLRHLKAEGLIVTKNQSEEPPPVDYSNIIAEFSNTLITLEQNLALAEEYKEIEKLTKIAVTLNKMKSSVAAMSNLSEIEVQRPGSNLKDSNKTEEEKETNAKLMFEKNLGILTSAILQLENDFSDQKPAGKLALIIGPDPQAQLKATTILTEYRSLSEFDPILLPFQNVLLDRQFFQNFGLNTRYIATLSYQSLELLFVFIMGAIGSLLYITKYYLHMTIQGHGWLDRPSRPLSWYLFRPIFGIVVALAIYLTVKAGQMAMGGSDSLGNLNLPIFSLISLFAGLLSWHALDTIESRAKRWFSSQNRRNLYATGLKNALSIEDKSKAECAMTIGCSEEQIERWLRYDDKVTPEMQDRLVTWLDRSVGEVFGDIVPKKKPPSTQGSEDESGDSGEPKNKV